MLKYTPAGGYAKNLTLSWSSCSASSQGARESRRDTPAMATMPRTGVPQRLCPYPLGAPPMDARTVEMWAAALGHEPHSDLRRQVLAGLGPAHPAHLVAQTQTADNRTGSLHRYLLLEVL